MASEVHLKIVWTILRALRFVISCTVSTYRQGTNDSSEQDSVLVLALFSIFIIDLCAWLECTLSKFIGDTKWRGMAGMPQLGLPWKGKVASLRMVCRGISRSSASGNSKSCIWRVIAQAPLHSGGWWAGEQLCWDWWTPGLQWVSKAPLQQKKKTTKKPTKPNLQYPGLHKEERCNLFWFSYTWLTSVKFLVSV